MDLVERGVEGLSCRALLAPRGWTVRVHHDIVEAFSLNVAHFESLDFFGGSLYVAEYFIPRATASDALTLQQELQKRLLACLSHNATQPRLPVSAVWELERPETNTFHSRLEGFLDQYTVIVCVVMYMVDAEFNAMKRLIDTISSDLKGRYTNLLQDTTMPDDSLRVGAGAAAAYTARGRCVVHVAPQSSIGAVEWSPAFCDRLDCIIGAMKEQFGLLSENLRLVVGGAKSAVAVLLLPLTPGVSLLNHCMIERVWAQHVKRSGWHSEMLMRQNISISDETMMMISSWSGVTPQSVFYFLAKEERDTEGAVAWITEPRVGSDSCVVLLTPASKVMDDLNDSNTGAYPCQKECEWLQRTFHLSIATAASWTSLGVGKEPGFLFREGGLVMRVPSTSMSYTNVSVVATAATSIVSLGSVCLTAEDAILSTRRRATFTLLKEFRSSVDYIDYIITEYLYDISLEKSSVFRKRRRPQRVMPVIKHDLGKAEEYSTWIQLKESGGAVYCVARECGVGRLLLIQACVEWDAVDETVAEDWETWVSGIAVLPVV